MLSVVYDIPGIFVSDGADTGISTRDALEIVQDQLPSVELMLTPAQS